MDILQFSIVVVVFVLAGSVKGVTGMGLPTVAMSLLGLWMAPIEAALILVVPSLVTNVAQCRGPYLRTLATRLWPGWLAISIVTACGPGLGNAVHMHSAKVWLGGILIVYGIWGLWRPNLPDFSLSTKWLSLLAGTLTGFVTALTAVFVLPWVPYLQTLRLNKDELVQALGLSFTVATLALAVRVQLSTPVESGSISVVILIVGALIGAFTGLKVGEVLRGRLNGLAFQRALFVTFMALGVANLAQV